MNTGRFQDRNRQQGLQFETLEERRVLATGIFDAPAKTLTVILDSNDTQVTFSHDGRFVTLNGSTDLDPQNDGEQAVRLSQVSNVHVRGTTDVANTIAFQESFEDLNNLTIRNVATVVLNGSLQLAGDLTIVQPASDTPGRIGDRPSSTLQVMGTTSITANASHFDLGAGVVDLGGDVNMFSALADGNHRLATTGPLRLNQVEIANVLRLEAPRIVNTDNAGIDVKTAYLKSDLIRLGDTDTDSLNFDKLNFKSQGTVDVSDDSNIELIGASFADSLSLVATDWISDANFARTSIAGQATFVGEQITIGDSDTDQFHAGQLTFKANTHAHFSAGSSMVLTGNNRAGTAYLVAERSIGTAEQSTLMLTYQVTFVSSGDISVGLHDNDRFVTSTVSFVAPHGHVAIHENDDIHILNKDNVAGTLDLEAEGNITDDYRANTRVTNGASFHAHDSVYLGDGVFGQFETGGIRLLATNHVVIEQDTPLVLQGENQAKLMFLFSAEEIRNADDAIINVQSRARFMAPQINVGGASNDMFNAGSISFDSNGEVQITEDSDTIVADANRADQLNLNSAGMLIDVPGAVTDVTGNAHLVGHSISYGGNESEFSSGSLRFRSDVRAVIHQNDEIRLQGNSRATRIRLQSTGSISNADDAALVATDLLDLVAESIDLGGQANDRLSSSRLSFRSTGDVRFEMDSDVLMVSENSAMGLEIISHGNITDADNARIHAQAWARFEGVDVILGDSETNCVLIDSDLIQVEASGVRALSEGNCGQ